MTKQEQARYVRKMAADPATSPEAAENFRQIAERLEASPVVAAALDAAATVGARKSTIRGTPLRDGQRPPQRVKNWKTLTVNRTEYRRLLDHMTVKRTVGLDEVTYKLKDGYLAVNEPWIGEQVYMAVVKEGIEQVEIHYEKVRV